MESGSFTSAAEVGLSGNEPEPSQRSAGLKKHPI